MIKKKISSKKSILLITILIIISQILVFFKEVIFARRFGVSIEADIFLISIQIPLIIYAVLNVAISSALMPKFLKIKKESTDIANNYLRNIITFFSIVTTIIVFIIILFTNEVVSLFAPTYDGETLSITVRLTRFTSLSLIFVNLSNIYKAIHNSFESFFIPVISGFFNGLLIILFIIIFPESGINGPIYALVLSYILQYIFLKFFINKYFKYKVYLNLNDNNLVDTLKIMLPIMIGVGVGEINRVIDRILATGLEIGSVSALNYASKITTVVSLLFISAVSIVGFQKLTLFYVNKKIDEFNILISKVFAFILILSFPATFGLIYFSKDVIYLVYEGGTFNNTDTLFTSSILIFYSIGIVFVLLREVISKVFYAVSDSKTVMLNSSIGIISNIILNIILVRYLGAIGLALATSISSMIIALLLFMTYIKRFNVKIKSYLIVILKTMISSSVMIFFMFLIPRFDNIIFDVYLKILFGIIIYMFVLYLMKEKTYIYYLIQIKNILIRKSRR